MHFATMTVGELRTALEPFRDDDTAFIGDAVVSDFDGTHRIATKALGIVQVGASLPTLILIATKP